MKSTRSIDVTPDTKRRLTLAKARTGAKSYSELICRALVVLEATLTAVCSPPDPSQEGKGKEIW